MNRLIFLLKVALLSAITAVISGVGVRLSETDKTVLFSLVVVFGPTVVAGISVWLFYSPEKEENEPTREEPKFNGFKD